MALRDVKQGEEFSVGYGDRYRDDQDKWMKCLCGSQKCSGWIGMTKSAATKRMRSHPDEFPNEESTEEEEQEDMNQEEMDTSFGAMSLDQQVDQDEETEEEVMSQNEGEGQTSAQCEESLCEEDADPFVKLFVKNMMNFKAKNIVHQARKGQKQAKGKSAAKFTCPCTESYATTQNAYKHLIRKHTEFAEDVMRVMKVGIEGFYANELLKAKKRIEKKKAE